MLVSQLLLRGFGTLFHWTVELLHPLTHLRSVSRHFSLIRHNRTVARASVLWRDINLLIDWLIDWSMLIKSWIYHCTSGLWITFVALIIVLCNNSVNVCLVVVIFWCLFFCSVKRKYNVTISTGNEHLVFDDDADDDDSDVCNNAAKFYEYCMAFLPRCM